MSNVNKIEIAGWNDGQIARHRAWTWKPCSDITAFEMAQAVNVLMAATQSWNDGRAIGKMIDELPENVRRHFMPL